MRASISLSLIAVAACSTVQSVQGKPPIFQQTTRASLASVQGCIAERTANQAVQFLPRSNGATFSGGVTTGASRFVTWVANVEDTGSERLVTVYATKANSRLALPAITACL